jgi:hypothetical protein
MSGIADSLNHVFLLPVTAMRLLTSDVVGFNLWVALPLPICALGTYLLLRVDTSRAASLLGSAAFAVSGPMASTPNFPNLAWTAALMPWVLWGARRTAEEPSAARIAALAVLFATQALCGEPVILGTSAAGALGIAAVFGPDSVRRRLVRVSLGLGLGTLLAGVQVLPLLEAGAHSARTAAGVSQGWPLHPVGLIETVVPHTFGHYYESLAIDRWMQALNDQTSPFFYSLYIGMGLLLWAVASRAHHARRVRWFWTAVIAITLAAAFGDHTPAYPIAQAILPPLKTLRFPIKYFLLTTLALSALASLGWDALWSHESGTARGTRSAVAVAGPVAGFSLLLALSVVLFRPDVQTAIEHIALSINVRHAASSASELTVRLAPLALRLAAVALGWVCLAWASRSLRVRRALPLGAMFALTIVDPAVINADLNPTLPEWLLRKPEWVRVMQANGEGRVYVGGRWGLQKDDAPSDAPSPNIDGAMAIDLPAEYSAIEVRSLASHELLVSPAAWGVHEVVSYDMPVLVPREYVTLLRRFVRHDREERLRFLSRTGVRYCVLPQPPRPGMQPLARLKYFPMALYECNPDARRVYVASQGRVVSGLADQVDALFSAGFDPATTVLLATEPPAAAGRPVSNAATVPTMASAEIVGEKPDELIVQAAAGSAGGYLVVLDSYASSWDVIVDGAPAPLLRAYAVFRAVHLAPGDHRVVFRYRPRALFAGLVASTVGLAGLVVLVALGFRSRARINATLAEIRDRNELGKEGTAEACVSAGTASRSSSS